MSDNAPRNDWHCRIYRYFEQCVVLHPSKEADMSAPFGDIMSSGVDVRVMGIEGKVSIDDGNSNYQVAIDSDTSGVHPIFTISLRDGSHIDLSKLKVAVDFDYHKALFPSKLEKFGRPNEITDTGELSGVMIDDFESLDLDGKYRFCTHRVAYLKKLLEEHKLEEKKLVYRFEQAGKKLYNQRHLLLISRVDAVKANLYDLEAWTKNVLLTMEKNRMVGEGFAMSADK